MQIVFNSCKLLVFKRYAVRRPRRLYPTVNVSELSNEESRWHGHPNLFKASSCCTPVHIGTNYNESKHCPKFFLIGDILHMCIPFENRTFSYLPFHFDKSCSFFFCILYMFTLYLALPKRETILNVLSLLFWTRLLFICLARHPVTCATADKEQQPPPSCSWYG